MGQGVGHGVGAGLVVCGARQPVGVVWCVVVVWFSIFLEDSVGVRLVTLNRTLPALVPRGAVCGAGERLGNYLGDVGS